MFDYRDREIFQLYEFVVMPDHVHLLLAPKATASLERTMQFIKGGYSHRYRKETGPRMEIWERSFTIIAFRIGMITTNTGTISI
jgi:putative transposase